MYIRRKRPEFSRREESTGPGLCAAVAAAIDAANARMRGFGRTEWDATDDALAHRLLYSAMRKMPQPWPDIANQIENANARNGKSAIDPESAR